jgi:hypothetical protein
LNAFNDWSNIQYNFRASVDFADGSHATVLAVEEMTHEQAEALSPDTDGDNVLNINDNCQLVPNPDQLDSNQDGVGDACADNDADGVLDPQDQCPASDLGPTVVIDLEDTGIPNVLTNTPGCTIMDLVRRAADGAATRDEFIRGVALLTRTLVRDGLILFEEAGTIRGAASRATFPLPVLE